jgi:RNase P subunit RPR2
MSQYEVDGERKIKYIYCQKCPPINRKRVRYRLENVIDGQVFLRCPGCGHRKIRNTYEYAGIRHVPRQDEWQQTEDTKERLTGRRCLDCDAIISEPAIVGRPAWCASCGGHAMIGNRKGMKAEAEYKGKNKPVVGSKTDSILNGNRVLRKYSIGANK